MSDLLSVLTLNGQPSVNAVRCLLNVHARQFSTEHDTQQFM